MEKTRLEAFSDGVIAIIITLLVLEIKVPHIEGEVTSSTIAAALIKLTPKILSWALSFFMVLIMWVNHHRIFHEIKQSDNGLMWMNGLLLFFMSFVPFPTAFMGDYFDRSASMFFFGICMGLTALAFVLLRLYILKNSHLLKDGTDKENYSKLIKLSLIGPVMYFLGSGIAFMNVYAAYAVYAIVPVYFIFLQQKKKIEE
ncbi:MAG: DUF1211 domain-containing protein [Ignavibacteriales bacterium]|nr:DUF1211 domain-containing protein [Ignavibacteriales bacterium]